ncbi:hypothetical protein ABZX90_19895 [Streptomyces sp. NPDC002935]|uniref:hypothetical protein n=1 Tax=Streptomyces sp. NPDC002935 TaxID=3154545 RepID=UPI0033AEB054
MTESGGRADAERLRLANADAGRAAWRRWGPYLSERQWGTVREDYSPGGDAWSYFTHDQAGSRAYRWGEARDRPGGRSAGARTRCRRWCGAATAVVRTASRASATTRRTG